MATGVAFCLLGPLTVRMDGVAVPIAVGKQRVVLAALLLRAGRTTTADQLTELLWGSALPPSAAVTLRNYVKLLRRAFGASRNRIVTQPGGYLIEVDPGELDITAMQEEVAFAHRSVQAGAWADAARHADTALAFWRGDPLCDIGSDVLALQEIPRLTELRFQARELRIEAGLHLSRHAELVGEARQLTVEAPMREHLHVLLLRALHECGRRAEALEAYQDARRVLAEELGCEPGTELQVLHREILNDHVLIPATPTPAAQASAASERKALAPHELPAAVASFTGRESELAAMDSLLHAPPADTSLTVLVTAIAGTAGVGKTALAVHWAHRVTDSFPGGQLYVNLRGYDPGQPVSAGDALAGFLRSLGVAGQDIPAEEGERAGRYRSLLARRRMLVVLDNARDADQVRPLLPGTPGCAALVTSRDALGGLVARDGARRLDLDLLPIADAVALLHALIGARADTETQAAAALAMSCCRLPLALRIAAELAVARPSASLAELASELADKRRRLNTLDTGKDRMTALRSVFSWSYGQLDADCARAFRLCGLHPGPELDAYAAGALTGTTVESAGKTIGLLRRAHLIQGASPGRYAMHDLLRDYARELALAQDSEQERRASLTRLLDYYLNATAAAARVMFPAAQYRVSRVIAPATDAPLLADPAEAACWLDGERASLVAATAHAAAHGWPTHAAEMAGMMFRYLDSGGHYAEASAVHAHARRAASQANDRAAEADALISLAIAEARQCCHRQAIGHLRDALTLFRDIGDRTGQARALANLGVAYLRQGRFHDAFTHLQNTLPLLRETGHRPGEASTLNNLGLACLRLGWQQQATSYLRRALTLSREISNIPSEARALTNLGEVEMLQGRHQRAAAHLQQALTLFRQTGDRIGEAYGLASLGDLNLRRGYHNRAISCHQHALTLFREIADRSGEAAALNGLAEVLLTTGPASAAHDAYTAALELAAQISEPYERARAHDGLANACRAQGDKDRADRHRQQALALYADLGIPADRNNAAETTRRR